MSDDLEFLESSTKIHTAEDLARVLRQTRAVAEAEPHREFEDDQYTRQAAVPELARESAVRKTAAHVIVRPTRPVVRAVGSSNELDAKAIVDEDAAFAPWDESSAPAPAAVPEVVAMPEPAAAPEPELVTAAEPELVTAAEPELVTAAEPELVEASPVPAIVPVVAARRRWAPIAWIVVGLAISFAGTLGYLRITDLEQELARTKTALDAANARLAQ